VTRWLEGATEVTAPVSASAQPQGIPDILIPLKEGDKTMRVAQTFGISAMLLALGAGSALGQGKKGPTGPGLTLTTTAFADGAEIPSKFTQSDPNAVSPKLDWAHVPPNTISFALILHDPDVALQRKTDDVLHWLIFNIPSTASGLQEAVPPTAQLSDGSVQAKNLRGGVGYMGPGAPAAGPHHHYTFELFALDTKLDLGPDATRADVLKAIDGHILGKGVVVGRFHR
jgi:Raf kinase inhibitor-like YbhB/YbcL family protein